MTDTPRSAPRTVLVTGGGRGIGAATTVIIGAARHHDENWPRCRRVGLERREDARKTERCVAVAEDHGVRRVSHEMCDRRRAAAMPAQREPRAEALGELFEGQRRAVEQRCPQRKRDGRPRADQRVGQGISVRAKEPHDVVAPEPQMPSVGAKVRDLPLVGPVVDRLEVHLAEVGDDLCAIHVRRRRRDGSSSRRCARRQLGGFSESHRSPRST